MSETVVILFDMHSHTTIYIVKCGCTVHEKYAYNFCKFVLYVDVPVLSSFRFSVLFVFFSKLSNRSHFLGFVIWYSYTEKAFRGYL